MMPGALIQILRNKLFSTFSRSRDKKKRSRSRDKDRKKKDDKSRDRKRSRSRDRSVSVYNLMRLSLYTVAFDVSHCTPLLAAFFRHCSSLLRPIGIIKRNVPFADTVVMHKMYSV